MQDPQQLPGQPKVFLVSNQSLLGVKPKPSWYQTKVSFIGFQSIIIFISLQADFFWFWLIWLFIILSSSVVTTVII